MSRQDQSVSLNKYNRNQGFAPSSFNLIHQSIHKGGILFSPPAPPMVQYHRQPPLLPLPISRPYSSLPIRHNNTRNLSASPPTNKKSNKNNSRKRNLSTSPKKSSKSPVKERSMMRIVGKDGPESSSSRLGPEPSDLPKEVGSRVFKSVISLTLTKEDEGMDVKEEICGSIFSLAPPPSSLPLPRFSLKPKLSCNLEAGGVDTGATDNLRRLLRLR